jgi:hypothetical protein
VEVTSAREHPVKTFSSLLNGGCSAYGSVLSDSDCEVVGLFVELNGVDDSVEMNPVKDIGLLDATNDVVFEDFTWRERGDSSAEVLLEGVVAKLQAFLRSVGPEVSVHSRVDGLIVLIKASVPVVVPLTSELSLLLETDDLRNVFSLILSRLECSEDASARGTSSNDTDSLLLDRLGCLFDHLCYTGCFWG